MTSISEFRPWAVIVAAGGGSRMRGAAGSRPKQFLKWRGLPLLWHSVLVFARCGAVRGAAVILPENGFAEAEAEFRALERELRPGIPLATAPGGPRRQDSVRSGLEALPDGVTHVLVHDAARPFLSAALVRRVCDALRGGAVAAIPGLRMTDTVKRLEGGRVVETLPRDRLAAVQTPQGFSLAALRGAHARADALGCDATDDAVLLEAAGEEVVLVEGESANRKITHPDDLRLLDDGGERMPRVGFGVDVHRYGPGRPLRLGGVLVGGDLEIVAHSDGDVLLHALMDALLGCAGLGDIGQHFPDSDPALDGVSSAVLLDDVLRLFRGAGLEIANADLTIVAQKPKIAPHREAIRANVARLLGIPASRVNVKATTEEHLGYTGRVEGIRAHAAVCAVPSAARAGGMEDGER